MSRGPKSPSDVKAALTTAFLLLSGPSWLLTLESCLLLTDPPNWSCSQDSDCPPDQKCPVSSRLSCRDVSWCATSQDCRKGWVCKKDQNTCIEGACLKDDDVACGRYTCNTSRECLTSCSKRSDCRHGSACISNRCTEPECSIYGTNTAECHGYGCTDGICNTSCYALAAAPCASGYTCIDSQCMPNSTVCTPGSRCDAGSTSDARSDARGTGTIRPTLVLGEEVELEAGTYQVTFDVRGASPGVRLSLYATTLEPLNTSAMIVDLTSVTFSMRVAKDTAAIPLPVPLNASATLFLSQRARVGVDY